MSKKILMNKKELSEKIKKLSSEILNEIPDKDKLALIGIRTAGDFIAHRIKKEIDKTTKKNIPIGILDITLYRDDFSKQVNPNIKETVLDFDITGKDVVLVDDVIWTGRTVRAALDHLVDFGRPGTVKLCALIDRGGRELPVQPDFTGKKVEVPKEMLVEFNMTESGGKDEVVIVPGSKRTA